MLNEEQIDRLLQNLNRASERFIDAMYQAEHQADVAAVAKASALEEHEFAGKNAEAREREALLTLTENATLGDAEFSLRMRRMDLERAKMDVEMARAAISLWKAAAYEAAGKETR